MLWFKSENTKRIEALEREIATLRRHLGLPVTTVTPGIIGRMFESSIKLEDEPTSGWRGDSGAGYHTANQNPPAAPVPWISKTVRITEQLTSFEYAVKTQLGQAILFGVIGLFGGTLAMLIFEMKWYAPLGMAVAAFTLALSILLLDHRGLVRKVINDQKAKPQQPKELRVSIAHSNHYNNTPNIEFLYLNGEIERSDVLLFARRVTEGKSLAIHGWKGVGQWTRPKLQNFLNELETMGYVSPGRGNIPRTLTRKGKALFKTLAEWKH